MSPRGGGESGSPSSGGEAAPGGPQSESEFDNLRIGVVAGSPSEAGRYRSLSDGCGY